MPPPEFHLRVNDDPVQRNRQLQEQHHCREPPQSRHARILIEPAQKRKYLSLPPRALTIAAFQRRIQAGRIPNKRCGMPQSQPWAKVNQEKLSDVISRQMVSGEEATLARILLARGAVVPRHEHRSEQYTMILSGALKFVFDDGETTVHAGEMLLIPAFVPHSAEALEDTVDIDFFAPRREEWIRGDDAYLRRGVKKD
jgi:quercetin dioxygenase-like cupin family protein